MNHERLVRKKIGMSILALAQSKSGSLALPEVLSPDFHACMYIDYIIYMYACMLSHFNFTCSTASLPRMCHSFKVELEMDVDYSV